MTPVDVTGDRDELIQVFENLIENACKYGQSGERVVVTLTPATRASGAVASPCAISAPASPRSTCRA